MYPKLPVQLKKYYKMFQKNTRVQLAMDNSASEIADTMVRIARTVPRAPAPAADDDNDEIPAAPMDDSDDDVPMETGTAAASSQPSQHTQVASWIQQTLRSSRQAQAMQQRSVSLQMQASLTQPGFLGYMRQQLRPAFTNYYMPSQLPASAMRPAFAQPLFAAGQSIGAAVMEDPEEREAKRRRTSSGRGPDQGTRSEKRCKVCLAAGREAECVDCPGRFRRNNCRFQ